MELIDIYCSACGSAREKEEDFRCICGGPFEISLKFSYSSPRDSSSRLLRYLKNFPYLQPDKIIELGEQVTPLVKLDEYSLLKLDYMNPTFSFKDRGSQVLISALRSKLKIKGVSEDSSGNAGASIAAYCAKAGLDCYIFTPETVSGPKALQIEAYGANLVKVRGSRNDVATEAMKTREGIVYIGHIWHPYFRDGIRTIAYELYEQLKEELSDCYIFLPVSAGTLLLGLISGLEHLVQDGLIDNLPEVVCCQTAAVSPLYHKLNGMIYRQPEKINSVADALVSTDPPLLELMARKCKKIGAKCVIVNEEDIISASKELSRRGFYVEPSSAVAYAAKKRFSFKDKGRKSITILTGSGLKSYGHSQS